jgi:hypothetical protein
LVRRGRCGPRETRRGRTARIDGHDVVDEAQQVRAAIGVTGQFSAVDTVLTGRETRGCWRICTTWSGRRGPSGRRSSPCQNWGGGFVEHGEVGERLALVAEQPAATMGPR